MTTLALISRTKCPRSIAIVVASILCVFLGPLKAQPATDPQTQIDQLRKELSDLKAAFDSFKDDNIKIEEELSQASTVILPVGSIVAYSGAISGLDKIPNWLPCDGRTVSGDKYPVLWDRIKTTWGGTGNTEFKLPDLRGRFLRGVDGGTSRDPDAATNTRDSNGIGERNTVGTIEPDSTKMPGNAFVASPAGLHDHDLNTIKTQRLDPPGNHSPVFKFDYLSLLGAATPHSGQAGQHTHTITGGDSETRPKNGAVFWIIRVQ